VIVAPTAWLMLERKRRPRPAAPEPGIEAAVDSATAAS
jgi:hypothetical protein